jgi:hypothetical protein
MEALMRKLQATHDKLEDEQSDAEFALIRATERLQIFEEAAGRGDGRYLRTHRFITAREADFMGEYDFGFNMLTG